MSQPTKGPVVKERVWRFIEALLTHAEDSSNFEIHWETDKDTGRPIFVVKTKRRFLESLAQLKQGEIYEVIETLENLQIWDDRRLKRGKGSEIGLFALKLWSKDAQRNWEQFERVWQGSRTAKSKALEATYNKSGVIKGARRCAPTGDDWREICLAMLEKQKRLTTNQLMSADEDMKFELDEIHVPLALVQRTKPDKRSGDVSPEEGSRLYEPTYEEKQRFKYEDFLAQVLDAGVGQSKGRRIALIGEPGAGKTTLLQAIAFWLLEDKNKNLGLPIWISLADLQGRTIKEYLLKTWLENALEVARVTPEQENVLVELFKSDRVWLLLDGVDEIAGDSGLVGATHASPLQAIASQLEGWVAKARVVLTCRLNVWEANLNALENFETYRLLDFDYPDQVKEFICRWFRSRDVPVERLHLDKGEQLWAELNKSEHQRIQDLVKNPLRLALLCSTWQSSDQGLPSTKAGLYQQFLTEFYKWKENRFPTTEDQQEELNAALGCLAKRAIDQEVSRFRLRHKLVREELGDPKQEGSLFWLALQLGWLNKVGLAAESETEEKVYAFFHPTFQEYFAALAIADWDFFLPRTHDNRNPKPVSERYRIFEPQWKEVILLWLGRPHEEVAKEQKEEFIKALVEFKDGFQDLYWYQAYFLAAAGIAELANCNLANEIVKQIVQWAFGYFDTTKQAWQSFPPLDQKAIAMLRETLRSQVITELTEFLHFCHNEEIRRKIVHKNGITWDERIISRVALTLLELSPGNLNATKAVKALIDNSSVSFSPTFFLKNLEFKTQIESLRQNVFGDLLPDPKYYEDLEEDRVESPEDIIELIESAIEYSNPQHVKSLLKLDKIVTGNPNAISPILNIIKQSLDIIKQSRHSSKETARLDTALDCMHKIGVGSPEAISILFEVVYSDLDYGNYAIRENAASALIAIGAGNPDVFKFLISLVHNGHYQEQRIGALRGLEKIIHGDLFRLAVVNLRIYLQNLVLEKNRGLYVNCYRVLGHCAQNMTYPAFYQAWHQQEGVE